MSFDRGGYESQVDQSRRRLWGDSAVETAAYEEPPNTMLAVCRTDMVRILRDAARDRERSESELTASELGYGPTSAAQSGRYYAAGSEGSSGGSRQPAVGFADSARSVAATASEQPSDPRPPGQTLTVRILDGQTNVIAVASVPLIGTWHDGLYIGDVASGTLTWRGGDRVSVVVGQKFDAQHRPIGGMPLEKWVHQYAGAKLVLVEIESAGLDRSNKHSGRDHQAAANSGTANESRSKSSAKPTASGSTAAPASGGRVDRSEGNGDDTKDGSYNAPGHTGSGTRVGGAEGGT